MKGPMAPKGQMGKLLKQAQKMQAEMARAQEEVATMEAEGSAGGGAVKTTVNGAMELTSIKFDPEIVDPEDVETLEDLVLVAVNMALKEIHAKSEERMARVTGGMAGLGGGGFAF